MVVGVEIFCLINWTQNWRESLLQFQVDSIDSLPQVFPRVEAWVDNVLMDEGNATILTLVVCLMTVLYLRERQRRHAVPLPNQPNDAPN